MRNINSDCKRVSKLHNILVSIDAVTYIKVARFQYHDVDNFYLCFNIILFECVINVNYCYISITCDYVTSMETDLIISEPTRCSITKDHTRQDGNHSMPSGLELEIKVNLISGDTILVVRTRRVPPTIDGMEIGVLVGAVCLT